MTKQEMKKDMDKHIKTGTSITAKNPGARRDAWGDVKALEILVKAARG